MKKSFFTKVVAKPFMKSCTKRLSSVSRMTGVFPTGLVPKEDLLALIRSLHPVASGRGLIRLGPAGDGGYLVPDDLEDIEACFSPGVDRISEFELKCAERGMKVFLADASVDAAAVEHPSFTFTKKYLGMVNDGDFMRIDDWVSNSGVGTKDDLLLQMDIEGFEYDVLLGMSEDLLKRLRVIVIEFHQMEHLFSQPYFNLISRMFERLLKSHVCVHHHPNNGGKMYKVGGVEIPSLTEMTFYRRDRLQESDEVVTIPHPQDADNVEKAPQLLPRIWYQ